MLNTTNTYKAKVQPRTVAVNNVFNIIIAIAIICGQWFTAHAQTITSQKGLTSQLVVRNAAGEILANQNIGLRLSIRNATANGTILYQETQTATSNQLGLVNIHIGQGIVVINTLTSDWGMDPTWAAASKFLQIEMDAAGGTNYINMGTTQLMSVPYAMYATHAGKAVGSVNYKGTWDANTNTPNLSSATTDKGDYYVVHTAGTTSLGGITDWNMGDWAIYNGTVWQKVDNTDDTVAAQDVAFTPNGDIVSTNVQDAIVEVRNETDTKLNTKQNLIGFTPVPDTRTINGIALTADVTLTKAQIGLSNVPDIDATNPSNTVQDATHRFVTDSEKSTWNAKQNKVIPVSPGNFAGLNASGDLTDSQRSPADYLDKTNTVAYTPTADYNPATKKYVDDTALAIDAQSSSKVNRAGDTMTGNLILNADPTAALGAATKKYVDDTATGLGISNKADKVSGATNGHFAALDASGNLTDGGAKEATNISFTPNTDITSTNVQDAIDELQIDFADLIDSYIHKTDDGVAIYLPPGGMYKRFGLGGETAPASPLGIKGEPAQDDQMITMTSADLARKWNINLNPTTANVDGFSIDNTTTGTAISRFFIDQSSTGNVGIGTTAPAQKLHIESSTSSGITGIKIQNTATTVNQGWSMGHLQDAAPEQDGSFAIYENTSAFPLSHVVLRPGGRVGINVPYPDTKLHVSRPPSDPLEPVNLAENTGILCLGQIDDNNLIMDSRQIQARHGSYISNVLNFTVSSLNLQPFGGGITINNGSTNASDKATITTNGMLGLGTLTPVEKIDIDGAIKIGTTTTANAGTFRWSGADFEGYDGTDWKSFTLSNWAGTLTLTGDPAITYNVANPKVGIGVAQPASTLDIRNNGTSQHDNVSLDILGTCENTSAAPFTRIGTKISSTGLWSTNPLSKDIGLYVANVSGQASAHSNLAAVLNGNVSIGDLTSSSIIGANGSRVLAIQNGTAPTSAISGSGLAADGGIQLYSQSDAMGTSTFNVMNGDGTIINLFRTAALTPANNTPVSPVYDPAVQALIENMRQRINELEAKLQALGLLN